VARFEVDPMPLGLQWYTWIRQVVQERFLV